MAGTGCIRGHEDCQAMRPIIECPIWKIEDLHDMNVSGCIDSILGVGRIRLLCLCGVSTAVDADRTGSESAGQESTVQPTVSFIITAYNEEKRIGEKLLNTLRQDYPRELLDLVVASDCSTDTTDDLVRSLNRPGYASSGPIQREERRLHRN